MTVENLTTNKVETKKPENSTATSPKTAATTPNTTATKTAESGKSNALVLKQPEGLFSNRPIEASSLNIVRTYNSVGSVRPVTASTIKFNSSIAISGNRPIGASSLIISDTYKVMGSRPVASNDIDDPALLMGFLD